MTTVDTNTCPLMQTASVAAALGLLYFLGNLEPVTQQQGLAALPGGAPSAFWDPEYMQSIPQASP